MKNYNNTNMKGRLYNYSLDEVSTEKGTALAGEIIVEVDEMGTQVAHRYFAYPTYASGKPNSTYGFLSEIYSKEWNTVVDNGDDASWISCSGNIDSQYFVSKKNASEGVLKSQKIRGSFINLNNNKSYANEWKLDMLITSISEVPADLEKDYPRFVKIHGYQVDDYRKRVLEVDFNAFKETAIAYLLGLTASEESPYYVSCWGSFEKRTTLIVRLNAFGESETDEISSIKWAMTGMSPNQYIFGDDIPVDVYNEYKENLKSFIEEIEKGSDAEEAAKLAF